MSRFRWDVVKVCLQWYNYWCFLLETGPQIPAEPATVHREQTSSSTTGHDLESFAATQGHSSVTNEKGWILVQLCCMFLLLGKLLTAWCHFKAKGYVGFWDKTSGHKKTFVLILSIHLFHKYWSMNFKVPLSCLTHSNWPRPESETKQFPKLWAGDLQVPAKCAVTTVLVSYRTQKLSFFWYRCSKCHSLIQYHC